MPIESVMPSSHLILCCPLLPLPPIPPNIKIFSNESAFRMRWPKYWSFSFNINPSNEHPGLISFRMDWLDLLEVQGTLKSRLQLWLSYKQSFIQITYDSIRIKSSTNLVWGTKDSFVSILKAMETFLDYALLDIWLYTCIHTDWKI